MLVANASAYGDPVVRSLAFVFYEATQDPVLLQASLDDQFMLGADLLVAPVMEAAPAARRTLYLPRLPGDAQWLHLWTREVPLIFFSLLFSSFLCFSLLSSSFLCLSVCGCCECV